MPRPTPRRPTREEPDRSRESSSLRPSGQARKRDSRSAGSEARASSTPAGSPLNRPRPVVTVRALAERLGMSKSTVAAALKGEFGYAPATVAKVREMARTLGYRPNPLVTANMARIRDARNATRRTSTLGYLSDVGRAELLRPDSPNHAGYLGARERAHELGFDLDLVEYAQPGMSATRLRNVIRNRGILGLIIAPHTLPRIELDLDWQDFATVCIGFSVVSPRLDRVGYDHHEAITEVCKRMWARGRRRLGLVMSEDFDTRVLHITRAGFLRWQSDHGCGIPILLLPAGDSAPLHAWLRRHRPECIIAPGVDIVERLASCGVAAQRDVVLTTTMQVPGHPELGGFDISLRTLARSAVDLLAAKLFRNEKGLPVLRQTVLVLGSYSDPVIDGVAVRPITL